MLNLSVKRIWLMVALFGLVTVTGASATWQLAGPDRPPATGELIAQDEEPAPADVCPPGERECEFGDEENQQEDGGDEEGGGGGGDGTCTWSGGVLAAALGAQLTKEIPCYLEPYGWYGGNSCYYGEEPTRLVKKPAPPEGKTEEDGAWYWETCFGNIRQFNGLWVLEGVPADIDWAWFDFEDVPTVSPEQLALQALASVTLDPVEFQLAPPDTGAGLVGLPVWLGIADTPNTLGPITSGDVCDGGLCVSITAQVTSVQWEMGDGTPAFTCQPDEHVTWEPGMDFLAPAGCHHHYQRSSREVAGGKYEITATSTWSVTYESTTGLTGGLDDVTRTSTTGLQIDEVQVLTGS